LSVQLIDDPIDVSSVIWKKSSHRSWLLSKMFPKVFAYENIFIIEKTN